MPSSYCAPPLPGASCTARRRYAIDSRRVSACGQRGAEIAVGVHRVGAPLQRLAERIGGFVVPALAKQRDADDVVDGVGVGKDGAEVRAAEDSSRSGRQPGHGVRRRRRVVGLIEQREIRVEPCRRRRRPFAVEAPRTPVRGGGQIDRRDAGTPLVPEPMAERTPYSWSGRSSDTGGDSRVARASVSAEPTNVPTISVTRAEIEAPKVRRGRRGALERARRARSGSISIRSPFVPTSSSSACMPDSSTDCGNTSMNARTIARLVSGGHLIRRAATD